MMVFQIFSYVYKLTSRTMKSRQMICMKVIEILEENKMCYTDGSKDWKVIIFYLKIDIINKSEDLNKIFIAKP